MEFSIPYKLNLVFPIKLKKLKFIINLAIFDHEGKCYIRKLNIKFNSEFTRVLLIPNIIEEKILIYDIQCSFV